MRIGVWSRFPPATVGRRAGESVARQDDIFPGKLKKNQKSAGVLRPAERALVAETVRINSTFARLLVKKMYTSTL
jgi:hypothetical protein